MTKKPTKHDPVDARTFPASNVEIFHLSNLSPDPNNARNHSPENVAAIRASLERFGQRRPLVVWLPTKKLAVGRPGQYRVICGNGALMAMREIGYTHAAAIRFAGTAAEAKAYAIADNRTAELADWNQDILAAGAAALRELPDMDALLKSLRLDDVLPAAERAMESADVAPVKPPKNPTTKFGDVWILGAHRLICDDSFDPAVRAELIGETPVDCVLTDPPYAIYGSSTGVGKNVADDKMVRPFFRELFVAIAGSCKRFAHVYVHCDWRSWATLWETSAVAGLAAKNCIVWNKGGGGLGSNYCNSHEFVGFWTNTPTTKTMTNQEAKGHRPVLVSNVWNGPRVGMDEREHNAAKPVALLSWLIENSTDEGERVLDLFGGSGSTLIACEQTKRRALVSEIEPAWCDVIVARWERLTGQKAVRS